MVTILLLSGTAASIAHPLVLIGVIALVCALCAVCFRGAKPVARTLGLTGNAVLSRLLDILLAAYSVQFVLNGIAMVRAA